jgi:monoamine oxidase
MYGAVDIGSVDRVTVAIVGGGLAGLQSARLLQAKGVAFCLVEARERLGGRILSADVDGGVSSDGFDLGPSWFWPELHRDMAATVAELGLATFPQYDQGDVLVERAPNAPPQRLSGFWQEPRSMRFAGGVGALVQALADSLLKGTIWLGARTTRIALSDGGVTLSIAGAEGSVHSLIADQVIIALPPRLIEATIAFAPDIGSGTRRRWRETATWMAPHAKFVAVYDRPFWREAGLSGMAQSMVGPLGEIHDATTFSGVAALFGFVGVAADQRAAAGEAAMKRACLDQLGRLFGEPARKARATLLLDWTADPLTATDRDRSGGPHPLPQHGSWVAGPWQNHLCLAGSETSASAPGYLAGALDAGQRAAIKTLERLAMVGSATARNV